jgi:hypothetical protein
VVNREREATMFAEKKDLFLDAISDYRREPTPESRARIARLAADLAALRPGFSFDLSRLDEPLALPAPPTPGSTWTAKP